MALDHGAVLAQIDEVLARCHATATEAPTAHQYRDMRVRNVPELSTACLAAIERLAPASSPYVRNAHALIADGNLGGSITLSSLVGVLLTLRADIEAGYLRTLEDLIHADLFADFLEMGAELLGKGYKAPAAVIAGTVLEEHLRKLAERHDVSAQTDDGRWISAQRLNQDLAGAGVYTRLDQSQVTAWLSLRNAAAHPDPEPYEEAQVAALIQGVRDFMLRHGG